jgi:hypothetical protein
MDSTPELDLPMAKPLVTPEQIELVGDFLRGKGWVKAPVICAALSISDRRLRVIVEYSDSRILSSPGSPGYRLFDREALPEADRAADRFISQGKRMIQHGISIRRRFHHFHHAGRV